MTEKEQFERIEKLDKLAYFQFRMDCGIGLLDVIYECMSCSGYDVDKFIPAVYAAREYFDGLQETLEKWQEELETRPGHGEAGEEAPAHSDKK